MKKKAKLILFDIDGTLIDSGGAGRRALDKAFFEITGKTGGTRGIIPDGKTDPLIITEMFQNHLGRIPTSDELEEMKTLYLSFLDEEVSTSPKYRVLLGVRELLEGLLEIPHLFLGLGTGNFEEGARIKLRRGDLNRFFLYGGYGSDSPNRVEVLKIGIRRGMRLAKRQGRDVVDVFIVGDTPFDIRAGRRVGAKTLAITSGRYSKSELMQEKPTAVITSLKLDGFLTLIGNPGD